MRVTNPDLAYGALAHRRSAAYFASRFRRDGSRGRYRRSEGIWRIRHRIRWLRTHHRRRAKIGLAQAVISIHSRPQLRTSLAAKCLLTTRCGALDAVSKTRSHPQKKFEAQQQETAKQNGIQIEPSTSLKAENYNALQTYS